MLIRDIASGRLSDGARLPPERDLAAGLGQSVGTLRKALALLERKGLLERRHGSGNYVRRTAEASSVWQFFRLELPEGGGRPTADLLTLDLLEKPAGAAFGTAAEAWRFRRIRRLDGLPVAAEEIWLDAARAERIAPGDVSQSLYLFYRERLGFWIARIEDRISLAEMPDWAAPLSAGPAVHVERIGWTQDDAPVEYSRTFIAPGRAVHVSGMG